MARLYRALCSSGLTKQDVAKGFRVCSSLPVINLRWSMETDVYGADDEATISVTIQRQNRYVILFQDIISKKMNSSPCDLSAYPVAEPTTGRTKSLRRNSRSRKRKATGLCLGAKPKANCWP